MNALLKLHKPVLGAAAANGAGVITTGDASKNICFSLFSVSFCTDLKMYRLIG